MTVYIEKYGDRIYIRSPYSEINRDRCKAIGGARWSKTAKAWTYPLDMDIAKEARRWFKDELEIGPELWAWAKEETRRGKELGAVLKLDPRQTAKLPRCEEVAPKLATAMYSRGYQTVAALFGSMAGSHLNADEMGLGKCVEAMGALVERGAFGRILVIAPLRALAGTWMGEIDKWLIEASPLAVNATVYPKRSGGLRTATSAERHEAIAGYLHDSADRPLSFLLINPEMLRIDRIRDEEGNKIVAMELEFPELFEVEWDGIIADETHRYLLNVSPRSKSSSRVGVGFGRLKLAPNGMKIALSGSPFKGRRKNLWGTLNWLYPDRYTSRWRWIGKYFAKTANAYSDYDYTDEFIDETAEVEFNRELDRIMVRRTADELHDLNPEWAPPPIQYYERWVTLGPDQRKHYDAMDHQQTVELEGGTLMANGILSHMTRLRQLASCSGRIDADGQFRPAAPSAKFDELMEILKELGITGNPLMDSGTNKVIVASQFTSMINLWVDMLRKAGIRALVITGETDIGSTERIVAEFQGNNESRVILLNTNAGGVSLTLDRADDVVIMDETWVPDDQSQVEFRARRASNVRHQVRVHYVRSRDTFEEEIAELVGAKDWNQKRVLDGRRGIEWAKAHWNIKEAA